MGGAKCDPLSCPQQWWIKWRWEKGRNDRVFARGSNLQADETGQAGGVRREHELCWFCYRPLVLLLSAGHVYVPLHTRGSVWCTEKRAWSSDSDYESYGPRMGHRFIFFLIFSWVSFSISCFPQRENKDEPPPPQLDKKQSWRCHSVLVFAQHSPAPGFEPHHHKIEITKITSRRATYNKTETCHQGY